MSENQSVTHSEFGSEIQLDDKPANDEEVVNLMVIWPLLNFFLHPTERTA